MKNNSGISEVPAYLEIYESLKKDIISGVFPTGAKLPSKRTLASDNGVSVITVEHAIALLCDEGYCEARERSGYYVIYRREDLWSDAVQTQRAVYTDLRQEHRPNEYAFPFSVIAKTMRKVLADYGEEILAGSPKSGSIELRSEICSYLSRSRRINVSPGQIIIGSGAEYLYGLLAQLFENKYIFAIEEPSYSKIQSVYSAFGVEMRHLPLGDSGIPTNTLEKTDASVLHVTPFNSYPSGITADASKMHEYLRWAEKRKGFIIEDNYDSELTVSKKAEDSLFSMSGGNGVVYINTFSHTIAPSMRVGYMILPSDLTEKFNALLGFYSCTVPLFEQYVIAELLRSGDFERHINRVRRNKRKKAD